jgi:hypothetical protein
MIYLGLFITELFVLFFLSQLLTKMLSQVILHITKSHEAMIHILACMLLPGVIVHELAHWFIASVLFVRTGEIEFWPKVHGGYVKLGSVAIEETDPVRRLLIGVAPLIIGLFSMILASYYLLAFFPGINWQTGLLLYIFFEIGNTMFSSKKDLEGALAFLIALGIILIILFGFGIKLPFTIFSIFLSLPVQIFFQKLDILLVFPLMINICLWVFSKIVFRR